MNRSSVSGARTDLLGDDVQVWCVRLERDCELLRRARSFLAEDEHVRAEGLAAGDLRDDFVVSRGLLRVLLARLACTAPSAVTFTYGPHGKPALDTAHDSLRFNVSHSAGIVAYAFARGCEVGIDIERHRPIDDCEAIAQRMFSPAEYDDLMRVIEPARGGAFFDGWARKEAFVKALGGGLSIPLDSFRVSLAPASAPALLEVRDMPDEERAWAIHAFSPAPGFSGAVAVRNRRKPLCVHHAVSREIFVAAGFW